MSGAGSALDFRLPSLAEDDVEGHRPFSLEHHMGTHSLKTGRDEVDLAKNGVSENLINKAVRF